MTNHDGVLEVERLEKRRQIVRIGVHLITVPGLARTSMPAPVMGDDAIAMLAKEQHLRVPVVRSQRPTVREHDRLSSAQVLVVDLYSVLRGDRRHENFSFPCCCAIKVRELL